MQATQSTSQAGEWTLIGGTMSFNFNKGIHFNQDVLIKRMKEERSAGLNIEGYRFIYSDEEVSTHSRAHAPFGFSCYEMMRAARDDNKDVRIFRNMNNEIACELVAKS